MREVSPLMTATADFGTPAEADQHGVGFAVHRRCGQSNFESVVVDARDGIAFGARLGVNR